MTKSGASKFGSKRRRIGIPIRYKMLIAVGLALLFAIGSYGYLAVTLFTEDKIAYIYDSNATRVEGLVAQTRSTLSLLEKELALLAHGALGRGTGMQARASGAEALFRLEQDMVRLQMFEPRGAGAAHRDGQAVQNIGTFINVAALEATELTKADLASVRKERPVPFGAILAGEDSLYIHNSSLPPSAGVLTVAYRSRDGSLIIVADILHERLLRIFGRSEHYLAYLVDERGEVIAHPNAEWVIDRKDLSSNPLVRTALASNLPNGVREFTDEEGDVQLGSFGRVGAGRLLVLSQVPKSVALRASRELTTRTVLFAVAILLVAFIASIFLSRVVTSPIRRLRAATEIIAQGRFDVDIDVRSRDEIGDLARAFGQMATALKDVQIQLVQSEKMAAFGQLGAGITHEVKNPMTGIVSFAQLAQRRLDDKDKTLEFLKLIEKEALRCRDILVNFLKFARTGSQNHDRLEVNELVEGSATMLRHQLGVNNVRLETDFAPDLPAIMGSAPELQQVILNLAINAQQAIGGPGKVRLGTARDGGDVLITVTDDGPGIPPDIRARIFEPFFTTKESGKGTGLGLSVSFGIVKGHNGVLSVSSEVGKGSTFTIRVPVARSEATATAVAPPKPSEPESATDSA